MDGLIKTMLEQLPNLAIAVWVLFSQQRTINMLLSNQQMLIDKLLTQAAEHHNALERAKQGITPTNERNA